MDQPETAYEMINKYGTYNIQPTADTSNNYPAIAHGLSEITKKQIKAERDEWKTKQRKRAESED